MTSSMPQALKKSEIAISHCVISGSSWSKPSNTCTILGTTKVSSAPTSAKATTVSRIG